MSVFSPDDGLAEKIGTVLGVAISAGVFIMVAWMMAVASGFM